jgi:uncharacterized delta-60 repeat protein
MMTLPRHVVVLSALLVALAWVASNPTRTATAANANVSVGVTVASATSINAAGCATGAAGVTDFGQVLAGASVMTSADCVVQFGSSNNTSALRLRQSDATGRSMFAYANGQLDTSFDGDSGTSNGNVMLGHPGFGDSIGALSAAVAGNGDLVLAGRTETPPTLIKLIRIRNNGTIDTAFDGDSGVGNGVVTIDAIPGVDVDASDIIRVGGTDLLMVGSSEATGELALIKIQADGRLDTSFDGPSGTGNGIVRHVVGAAGLRIYNFIPTSDGRYLATGQVDNDFLAVKFDANGVLDTSFDGPSGIGNGVVKISVGATDVVATGIVRSDGKIVLVGNADTDVAIIRLLSNGSYDTAFDGVSGIGNGVVRFPSSSAGVRAATTRADGFVTVVQTQPPNVVNMLRVDDAGILDPTFDGPSGSGNGTFTFQYFVGGGTWNVPLAMTAQEDGKVIVAGFGILAGGRPFTARHLENGALDSSFGSGGSNPGVVTYSPSGWSWAGEVVEIDEGQMLVIGNADGVGVYVIKLASSTVPDYNGGSASWANAMFGACLDSVSNAGSAWALGSPCTAANGPAWNDVPSAAENVATASTGVTNATVRIRFGFKVASNQTPANYYAPITFEVVAPG